MKSRARVPSTRCNLLEQTRNEEELRKNDEETISNAQEKAQISFFSLIHHSHTCDILHHFADNGSIIISSTQEKTIGSKSAQRYTSVTGQRGGILGQDGD